MTGSPTKLQHTSLWGLALFSMPSVMGSLFEPLAGVVDTALVGQLNTQWLASLAIGVTLLNTFTWMFNFLVHASTQSISSASGKGEGVTGQVQVSLFWALGVGLVSALALLLFKPFLYQVMGVAPELENSVDSYFLTRLLGHPLTLLMTTSLSLLRGLQKVRESFWMIVVSCALNIVFTWFALWVLDWGLFGVAMGTILSHGLGLLGALFLIFRDSRVVLPEFFKKPKFLESLSFGKKSLHLFGRSFVLSGCFFISTRIAGEMGVIELASYQVALQFWLFSSFVIDGIAMSATILCAHYVAKNQKEIAKEVARLTLFMGLILGCVFCVVYFLLGPWLWSLFTPDAEVKTLLKESWAIIAAGQVILCFSYVYDGILFGLNSFSFLRRLIFWAALLMYAPMAYLAWSTHELLFIWVGLTLLGLYRLVGGALKCRELLRLDVFLRRSHA